MLIASLSIMIFLSLSSCNETANPIVTEYTITFIVDDSEYYQLKTDGEDPLILPDDPTKEDYTFIDWYVDKDTWSIKLTNNYQVISDITVYARWEENQISIEKYTITFNSNGGSSVESITKENGTTITAPTNPIKEGYSFIGWYKDSELTQVYIFTAMTAENITVYAKWQINQYTITFESNDGSLVQRITQDYNSTVTKPTDPTKEGYVFDGWYSDSDLENIYIFNIMVSHNITLYAKWIKLNNITFNTNGGTSINQYEGLVLEEAPITNKTYYKFTGWYDNENFEGNAITFPYTIPCDIILYAKWEEAFLTFTYDDRTDSYIVSDCYDNAVTVVIPSQYNGKPVTSIGDLAFSYCLILTNIKIPSSITGIGSSAFRYCSSLTSIVIPEGVISIGTYAFSNCGNLTSVIIEENSQLISIGLSAFEYCSNLISITIPDGVTSIGTYTFSNCNSLTSVIIGENSQLTSIDDLAFFYCSNLTSIVISSSVTSIGYAAFEYCSNLSSVTIGENSQLTSISSYAFSSCSNLISIVIPSGVTSIGSNAFLSCSSLIIYCEDTSKPSGWSSFWNPSSRPVVWGCNN